MSETLTVGTKFLTAGPFINTGKLCLSFTVFFVIKLLLLIVCDNHTGVN